MEVHHHSHSGPDTNRGHRKKWSHYFWEFLMLFLAVFCGFMAENYREHKIEHKRAKQFAVSLVNDFARDTVSLNTAIANGKAKNESIDSLLSQLDLPPDQWKPELIYKYQGPAGRIRPVGYHLGTYEQMKSSGSLRYFDQKLSDILNQYAVQVSKTKAREDILLSNAADRLIPFVLTILDARILIQMQEKKAVIHPLTIRKHDDETIAYWISISAVVQSTQERAVTEYEAQLKIAKEAMEALKAEYHLD